MPVLKKSYLGCIHFIGLCSFHLGFIHFGWILFTFTVRPSKGYGSTLSRVKQSLSGFNEATGYFIISLFLYICIFLRIVERGGKCCMYAHVRTSAGGTRKRWETFQYIMAHALHG